MRILKKLKAPVFTLIQLLIVNNGVTQDFQDLPSIGGDLDSWYMSVAKNIDTPVMKGVHFYKKEDQMISPEQNPFLEESWDREGTITFEGRQFKNLSIAYNLSEDQLLIWNPEMAKDRQKSLSISQSKIDSFTIHKQKFINHKHADIGSQGFYKKVMQGKHLICFSKISKTGSLEDLNYEYEEHRQYWVKYKGEFFDYKRTSSLYKIFPNDKKQIRKYHQENGFIARGDKERYIQLMLYYCDSIVE